MRAKLLLLSSLAVLAAVAPAASAAEVSRAFGNTILSTYPDGRTAELWLRPDGSYSAEGRRGDASRGRWSLKGAKLCLKQSKPFSAPFSYCTPIPASGMGRPWSAKAVTGEQISVRLVSGHQVGKAKGS
jgi:hypothetical protein